MTRRSTLKSGSTAKTVTALSVLLLLATGCGGGDQGGATTPSAERFAIAIADQRGLVSWPLYIAMDQGYFEDENIDLEVVEIADSAQVMAALNSGDIDVAMPGSLAIPLQAEAGNELRAFVNIYNSDMNLTVAADSDVPDSDDWRERLRAMEGKAIGVPGLGSILVLALNAALENVGLTPDAVELIALAPGPPSVAALEAGQVDGFMSDSFAAAAAVGQGVGRVIFATGGGDGAESFQGILQAAAVAPLEALESEPEKFAAFARAIERAHAVLDSSDDEDLQVARSAIVTHYGVDESVAEFLVSAAREPFTPALDRRTVERTADAWRAVDLVQPDTDLEFEALVYELNY
jgi:NitT/TauT family transport system substrate-binding protein